jgi:myosin heavy subunit
LLSILIGEQNEDSFFLTFPRLIFKANQPIYAEDVARHYYKSSPLEVTPHIFLIASEAYKNMKDYKENQTIIVTGESGAGKTEAAKQLMTFVTLVCSDESKGPSKPEVAPQRRGSVVVGGKITSVDGLSLNERIDAQRKMTPADKVLRGLSELEERDSVNKRLKSRNVKARQSKNVLAAIRPNAQESLVLKSSAENEADLRESFEVISSTDDTGEYVNYESMKELGQVEELMEMRVIDDEFLQAVMRGAIGQNPGDEQVDATEIKLSFPQFKIALKLIEVEVQYVDDTSKAERRRRQSVFDYHHVAMEYDETSSTAASLSERETVNPLQLLTLNDIRSQLLESNPVLEAFGNSQTIRNDNSSRFGKYLELQFNLAGNLIGGKVSTYLLEKARLVHQSPNEKNFHVLHLFTQGTDSKEKEQYFLDSADSYFYLQYANKKLDGDEEKFTLSILKDSMKKIGIDAQMQNDIFQLLSAILSMGNLIFEDHGEDVAATITNPDLLARCCMLLHVDPGSLEAALVTHKLHQNEKASAAAAAKADDSNSNGGATRPRRMTVAIKYHDKEQATISRDTLAKELYNRLFLWIVNAINTNIEYRGSQKRTMGILDIYGFEIFDDNHFEQFCINWVNEKLQQFFIEQTLRAEQEEYKLENVEWIQVDYFDNKVVVDLIENKGGAGSGGGILSCLDDQQSFRNCNAETFTTALKNLMKSHPNNSSFIAPEIYQRKNTDKNEFKFGIHHYAGDVCYNTSHFLEKNTEALYGDIIRVMSSSRSSFISGLFADHRSNEEKSKRPPTLGNQFKKHLNDLVNTLKSCKPHYVRCIKPNDAKSPEFIDDSRMIHQIQYLGIVENVKVRRAGFCYRETYTDFIFRYRMLSTSTWPKYDPTGFATNGSLSPAATAAIDILTFQHPTVWRHAYPYHSPPVVEAVDYKLGRSKLFLKDPTTVFLLEKNRTIAINAIVRKVQSTSRGHLVYKKYQTMRRGFIKWQAAARRFIEVKRFRKSLRDILKLQSCVRKFIQRCRFLKFKLQFQNIPPRLWAKKIQSRARGFAERRALAEKDPKKYEQVQEALQKIRDARLRWSSAIRIAKIARGIADRKRCFRRRLAWNRLRVCLSSCSSSRLCSRLSFSSLCLLHPPPSPLPSLPSSTRALYSLLFVLLSVQDSGTAPIPITSISCALRVSTS